MLNFLISYQNNIPKIGKTLNGFKLQSFDENSIPTALLTEDNEFLAAENGTFLIWNDNEEDGLVYRFLANDLLPSPEIDFNRILYGDY